MSALVRMRSMLKNRKGQLKMASLLNKPKMQPVGDNLLKVKTLNSVHSPAEQN